MKNPMPESLQDTRHDDIHRRLNYLCDHGYLEGFIVQSRMPGYTWSIFGPCLPSRTYTTAQVEVFIEGALCVLDTQEWLDQAGGYYRD